MAISYILNPFTGNFDAINGTVTPVPVDLANASDWVAYTPIFTNLGTVINVDCFWRRSGDSVEIQFAFDPGTGVAAPAQIGLPAGLTSDATKIPTYAGGPAQVVGASAYGTAGSVSFYALASPSVTYFGIGIQDSGDIGYEMQNGNVIASRVDGFARIPIAGWTSTTPTVIGNSNVALAAGDGIAITTTSGISTISTAPVAAQVGASVPTSFTTGSPIIWDTVSLDSHSAYSTSTGLFTTPVAGYYEVSTVGFANTTGFGAYIIVNGSPSTAGYLTSVSIAAISSGSSIISLSIGDTVGISGDTSGDVRGNGGVGFTSSFSISRI